MNVYKNLATKVKYLLATEKNLEPEDRKCFQWQLLASIPKFDKFSFVMGKGGANTMFFQAYEGKRELCLPEAMSKLLDRLSNSEYFCYCLYDKEKEFVMAFLLEQDAMSYASKKAKYIIGVKFNGKKRMLQTKQKTLTGDSEWSKA